MEEEKLETALASLDEIDKALHQMLILAELSAGEGNINRPGLQAAAEHLKKKIDGIASRMEEI